MANRFDNGTKKTKMIDNVEQLSIDTVNVNPEKKVNVMLRLDPYFGAQVKAKAKMKGLPVTKYIELLIREDINR